MARCSPFVLKVPFKHQSTN